MPDIHIVVAEDDRQLCEAIAEKLRGQGFEVDTAANGSDAWVIIQERRPDLVISDLLIRGLHGLELCQRIKSDPRLAQVKVVLMTAVYKKRRYQHEAKQHGADLFWVKPLDFDQLHKEIAPLLGIETASSRLGSSLKRLSRRFARNLPSRVADIQSRWSRFQSSHSDHDWQAFFKSVHELAGSSESFGYKQLGARALELDEILVKIRNQRRTPAPDEIRRIESLLAEIFRHTDHT